MLKGAVVPKYQMSILDVGFTGGGTGWKYKPDTVREKGKTPAVKITDPFGEHIGGARKELWNGRGLTQEDIVLMNGMERDSYIKKDNIWKKPDYMDMIRKGVAVEVVYAIKKIRDSIMPTLPHFRADDTDELRLKRQKEYITFCSEVRDMAMGLASEEDLYGIFNDFLVDKGYVTATDTSIIPTQKGGVFLTKKLFTALCITKAVMCRYQKDIRRTGFGTEKGKGCRKVSNRKTAFIPKQLQNIQRTGLGDVRHGKDMTGEDFLEGFGIRGGEFGNWLTAKDAQASLNMAYEAMHDFAKVLGILPGQVSFGGRLSIAFGARGKGKAAAHYEPMREVINLTKMNGAGSLGHELFHAFDDIIGKKLGLDGMMTENRGKTDKIPYSVLKLFEIMCFRDETDMEREKRMEKERRRYEHRIRIMADCLVPDNLLTDVQTAKKAEIVKEIIAEAQIHTEEVPSDNCFFAVAQKLSELKKEAAGRRISKKDMIRLQSLYEGYILYVISVGKKEVRKVTSDYLNHSRMMDGIYSRDSFGYWSSLCEMFARAGACYLNDRLRESGERSDYLCGQSESCISVCGGADGNAEVISAVPSGMERKAINSAMEDMLTDLRERGLFMTDVERAGMVRGSVRARLENGCLLKVSYSDNPAASEGCDACISYSLCDSGGELTDGGEMDYNSKDFHGNDVALMVPEVAEFCFGKKNMGYMLMAGEENGI